MSVIADDFIYLAPGFNIHIHEWARMGREREIQITISLPERGTINEGTFKVYDPTLTFTGEGDGIPLRKFVADNGLIAITIAGCKQNVLRRLLSAKQSLLLAEECLKVLEEPNDLSESLALQYWKDEEEAEIKIYE
jgi:hypothetical protein